MGVSAEVRWFFRGGPPTPVAAWFEHLGAQPQERADRYLRMPETDALGVKVRGGQEWLELKLREQDLGKQDVAGNVAGMVEQWRKWSFEQQDSSTSTQWLGLPPERWVTVHKVRRLATYAPPDWTPSLQTGQSSLGCNVEFTDLRTEGPGGDEGEPWSTLGLESFGPDDSILDSLRHAATALFADLDLPQGLHADLTCGYPGWLQQLEAGPVKP